MSWARHAVEVLGRGEPVQVRPRGHIVTAMHAEYLKKARGAA